MNEQAAYTVFGAGSVGTVLAGLLASSGITTALMGRNATSDLHIEGDDETVRVSVRVAQQPEGVLLLCVHESQVAEVCERWPDRTFVTFSNGVGAEDAAARHGGVAGRVMGGVWRMTCTLLSPGRALFTRRGRIVVGRWPGGSGAQVEQVARDLGRAGFDVGVSSAIADDIWLKLLCNIGSTANALVPPAQHTDPRFGAIKAALVSEAWEALQRNGITARSCDGHDAGPEEEIERQRRTGPRARPVYNDTWRRLQRGLPPQERYHRIVADLRGEAPLNARMDEILISATEPESICVDDLATALGVS